MGKSTPSPSAGVRRNELSGQGKLVLALSLTIGGVILVLIIGRVFGLICPFYIPTGAMSPAVAAGDHVLMEGVTYLSREPRRGDVLAFRTDGIAGLEPGQVFTKRVAGVPGDRLRISDGHLYVNGTRISLTNSFGEILYTSPYGSSAMQTNVVVPASHYFVLGDNSTNSLDSRYWGCLPRKNIRGRLFFCYSPASRFGVIE